jgi:hypothetical protein
MQHKVAHDNMPRSCELVLGGDGVRNLPLLRTRRTCCMELGKILPLCVLTKAVAILIQERHSINPMADGALGKHLGK